MSNGGMIVAALAALALVAWVARLVRRDRMYVGYAVILVIVVVSGVALLPFLETQTLALLAVAFLVLMLVYTLSQMTLIANRLTTVVQEIAITEALKGPRREQQRGDGR